MGNAYHARTCSMRAATFLGLITLLSMRLALGQSAFKISESELQFVASFLVAVSIYIQQLIRLILSLMKGSYQYSNQWHFLALPSPGSQPQLWTIEPGGIAYPCWVQIVLKLRLPKSVAGPRVWP